MPPKNRVAPLEIPRDVESAESSAGQPAPLSIEEAKKRGAEFHSLTRTSLPSKWGDGAPSLALAQK